MQTEEGQITGNEAAPYSIAERIVCLNRQDHHCVEYEILLDIHEGQLK